MKYYLIAVNGPKSGLPISIDVDLFLLGSDPMCQLRAKNLGARQCALVARQDKVVVRDFDSGQPTLINGQQLPAGGERPVHSGDRLEVGPLQFLVHFERDPNANRDLEDWAASCFDLEDFRTDSVDHDDSPRRSGSAADAAAQIIGKLNALTGRRTGRLRIRHDPNLVVVRIDDESIIEKTDVDDIRAELTEHLSRPNLRVLIDFKSVRRMSSSAITMIAEFSRWLRGRGGALALCRIDPELRELAAAMSSASVRVFDSPAAAAASKW